MQSSFKALNLLGTAAAALCAQLLMKCLMFCTNIRIQPSPLQVLSGVRQKLLVTRHWIGIIIYRKKISSAHLFPKAENYFIGLGRCWKHLYIYYSLGRKTLTHSAADRIKSSVCGQAQSSSQGAARATTASVVLQTWEEREPPRLSKQT